MKFRITIALLFLILVIYVSCDARVIGLSVKPQSWDYGRVNLGDSSAYYFKIKNLSGDSYRVTGLTILGFGAESFSITAGGAVPIYLAPGGHTLLTVQYRPKDAGQHIAYLQISHTGPRESDRIELMGIGFPVPRIKSSTTNIDFGVIYISKSGIGEIEIENTGTSTLTLSSLMFENPAITEFTIKSGGSIPVIINIGEVHKIEVEFTPLADKAYNNVLLISHDAVNENSPFRISLTGSGVSFSPEMSLNQTSPWDFGSVAKTMPSIQNLEISSIGLDPLTVTSITFATGSEFILDSVEDANGNVVNLPQLVQVGTKIIAKVKFAPTANSTYNDTISIVHDGLYNPSPFDISVTGQGRDEVRKVFNYTGSPQQWTVPAGVTFVYVECLGAEGGQPNGHGLGGKGGQATAKVPVSPGDTVHVYVGQKPYGVTGGWNGGGTGCLACTGAGGGGASDVRVGGTDLGDRKVVGAGGGGGGYNFPGYGQVEGGDGGGLTGDRGTSGYGPGPGSGGTQTAGGASGGSNSTPGSFGVGGNGYGRACGGGGGGGGWYGGGGSYCDGGGGGSSYYDATGNTDKATTKGVRSGNGEVTIKY